jgi:hypothetical protein
MQDSANELLRIPLPRTPVNRSLRYYSSHLGNCSKASRAFEEFSRSGLAAHTPSTALHSGHPRWPALGGVGCAEARAFF